jgi:hypothetical protein
MSMVKGRLARRFAASLALVGCLGFAGMGEAAETLARLLGAHGACHMACCRERPDASCPRGHGTSPHDSHEPPKAEPNSPTSVSPKTSCEDHCALFQGLNRDADSRLRTVVVDGSREASTAVPVTTSTLSLGRYRDFLPPRAPPA